MIFNKTKRGASRKPVRKVRQPIVWQNFIKHGVALVFVMLTLSGGLYLYQDDTLPILHVTVEGEFDHVNRDDFVAAVSPYATGSFMSVDVASLRHAGEALPWVKQLQIRRVWPDSLHFIVEEHAAVAQWKDYGLVSSDGTLFSPPASSFPKGLPVLSGPEQNHLMVVQRYQQMQKVLKQHGLTLERLEMDDRRAWALQLADGISVKLGRESSQQRFERFIRVLDSGLKAYQQQIQVMDMRYTNGLAVQWKHNNKPDFNGTV